jgi:hypothetical protein
MPERIIRIEADKPAEQQVVVQRLDHQLLAAGKEPHGRAVPC